MGSSWSRDGTNVSCIGRWILYHWATREAHDFIDINQKNSSVQALLLTTNIKPIPPLLFSLAFLSSYHFLKVKSPCISFPFLGILSSPLSLLLLSNCLLLLHILTFCANLHFTLVSLEQGMVKGIPLWRETRKKLCCRARVNSLFCRDWYSSTPQQKLMAQ